MKSFVISITQKYTRSIKITKYEMGVTYSTQGKLRNEYKTLFEKKTMERA
jgi:hypothetical protein